MPLPLDRIVCPPLGARKQRRLPAPGPTALGWQVAEALLRRGLAVLSVDEGAPAADRLRTAERTAHRHARGVWRPRLRRECHRMLSAAGRE